MAGDTFQGVVGFRRIHTSQNMIAVEYMPKIAEEYRASNSQHNQMIR